MNIPFWEESYKDDNISTFGTEPNASVQEYENLYNKSWNILEVGCGEGKNSLYLAGAGYTNVNAFDISENAIKKLNRIAQKESLNINAWVQDLREFTFEESYDLIVSFGTLHFVSKRNWIDFINEAKRNTNVGGIHIMQIFTNKVPASPDIEPFAIGLADENEIKDLYKDWKILQYKSYVFEDEHPGVPKHFHASNKIIAQFK